MAFPVSSSKQFDILKFSIKILWNKTLAGDTLLVILPDVKVFYVLIDFIGEIGDMYMWRNKMWPLISLRKGAFIYLGQK